MNLRIPFCKLLHSLLSVTLSQSISVVTSWAEQAAYKVDDTKEVSLKISFFYAIGRSHLNSFSFHGSTPIRHPSAVFIT
jgi:hypothetical protein